ncbi:MAG: DUF4416 family protein, partial [Spirochaetes bacterium]|nr:DUF4416 family protein [Spirochaetota bacterium]
MGKIKLPEKAKLFIGIIAVNDSIIFKVKEVLEKQWGKVDEQSDLFPFDLSDYYKDEMGERLLKKFYSFKMLINREDIVDIKIRTNRIEEEIKADDKNCGRDINLDPGYITLSNVTLATTKDFRHRIYLGKGIYLENTLYYDGKKKTYMEWEEWTYPDYRMQEYKDFFNKIRQTYHRQLK